MTTTTLHPVKWKIESTSPNGFYGFAFGGGLLEAICTDACKNQESALLALRDLLAKVGRCPDKSLCNERTEAGRELLAVLS